MSYLWLMRLLCCICAIQLASGAALAYQREDRVPLVGCRGFYSASGAARYFAIRNVGREKDREELLIEVDNVPLVPGTVLLVYVGDEVVGKITLGKRQSGSLKLSSGDKKVIQPMSPGGTIMVKTVEGRNVLW